MNSVGSAILRNTVTMILAGGQGKRLSPLTKYRGKPAVPFGGKYRIIDFALSNCLNSGFRKIYVLTQYKSDSLNMHLYEAWSIFNPGLGEFIYSVPPQRKLIMNGIWEQQTQFTKILISFQIKELNGCLYLEVIIFIKWII